MADGASKSESAIPTYEKQDTERTAETAIASKKKICRYFKKGFCGYGEKCVYSHYKVKIRPHLGSHNPSDVENCRFFKKGSCKFASKCWYNHLRPNGKPFPKPYPLNTFIVVGPSGKESIITDSVVGSPDNDSTDSGGVSVQEAEPRRNFKRPQNLDIVSKNCFYYEQKGTCYYGDRCWYSHSESVRPADEHNGVEDELEFAVDRTTMCYNFIFDVCEFGDDCLYVHGEICQICDLAFLNPYDEQQRNEHLEHCEAYFHEDMKISSGHRRSQDKICVICLDNVWGWNKVCTKWKFGFQSECNHVFCLDCIRRWRAVKLKNNEPKRCPACRVESFVVVPSFFWFENDKEKKKLVANYKTALSKRPCKFHKKCKNKENCPYSHAPEKKVKDGNISEELVSNNGNLVGARNLPEEVEEVAFVPNQDDARNRNPRINLPRDDSISVEQIYEDLNLQTGAQASASSLTWEQQHHGSLGHMSDIWEGTPQYLQSNEDLFSQSNEQASFYNGNNWNQHDANLGRGNRVDDYDERTMEQNLGQDSDTWNDTQPEDKSNEVLVLPSDEQASTTNWEEEFQFKDSLGHANRVDGDERIMKRHLGQDSDTWNDTQPEDKSNEVLVLPSDEQASTTNWEDEFQFKDSLGQENRVDEQQYDAKYLGQVPDIFDNMLPEDQSNEDLVLQSSEQISDDNLIEEAVDHQLNANLGHIDVVHVQRDVERQIDEQDPDS